MKNVNYLLTKIQYFMLSSVLFIISSCENNSAPATDLNTTSPINISAPYIILTGDRTILLTLGDKYFEYGAEAYDGEDKKITNNIIINSSSLEINKKGKYIVTYNVRDSWGNKAKEITRTVIVQSQLNTKTIKQWEHGKLLVEGHVLKYEDGTHFFWMGDTAWDLAFKLNENDISFYMKNRKAKGFNVLLISAIKSKYLLRNVKGQRPFTNDNYPYSDYSKPNNNYWEYIDYIIDKAEEYNLYVALLPAWNNVIQNVDDAEIYGKWIAKRYKNKKNIIWVMGGDCDADKNNQLKIWDAFGNVVKNVIGKNHLITYHPTGSTSSSKWEKYFNWIDFNIVQSGHCLNIDKANYLIRKDYESNNFLPVLDSEPRYEGILKCFYKEVTEGITVSKDIRKIAYTQVFSGAFGHTYGNQSVWQFYKRNDEDEPESGKPIKEWKEALDDSGAEQMIYLRKLMQSRPLNNRIPDQSIILSGNAIATKGDGYLYVYLPMGGEVNINLNKISAYRINASWYSPRTGNIKFIDTFLNNGNKKFSFDDNDDIVLILDDESKNYSNNK